MRVFTLQCLCSQGLHKGSVTQVSHTPTGSSLAASGCPKVPDGLGGVRLGSGSWNCGQGTACQAGCGRQGRRDGRRVWVPWRGASCRLGVWVLPGLRQSRVASCAASTSGSTASASTLRRMRPSCVGPQRAEPRIQPPSTAGFCSSCLYLLQDVAALVICLEGCRLPGHRADPVVADRTVVHLKPVPKLICGVA